MEIATFSRPQVASEYVQAMRTDASFYKAVGLYYVAGLALSRAIGQPQKFPFGGDAVVLPAVFLLLLVVLFFGLSARRGWSDAFGVVFEPRRMANISLFCALFVYLQAFGDVKSMLPAITPFHADPLLMKLDAAIHGQNAWRLVEPIVPDEALNALEMFYFGGWSGACIGAMMAALMIERFRRVRAQYVWTYIACWSILGNVIAAVGMSGGPALYDVVTGDPAPFAHLRASLASVDVQAHAREMLIAVYHGKLEGSGLAISAFPSMHLSMATLVVLVARHAGRWIFGVSLAFLAVILILSVQFGWHYAIDGYFAIAATVLIWKLVGRFTRPAGNRPTDANRQVACR